VGRGHCCPSPTTHHTFSPPGLRLRLPNISDHKYANKGTGGKQMVPSIFHALLVPLLCIASLGTSIPSKK